MDNAGNRTAKQNWLTGVTENYSYDALYQLTQVLQGATATESYSYDKVGNRLSSLNLSPWSYNSSNQLTSTPTATYTYDNNGNTTSKTDANGTTGYGWDYENRLTSVTLPGVGRVVTFTYDPFGRRIQKSSAGGTVNYVYDRANLVAEVDALGNAAAAYAQGAGIDEPLAMWRAGVTSYYQTDGLGSITSLGNAAGVLSATYTYDAFGNLTNSAGDIVNPFRYTGREWDQETGLYYYRARYYDPSVGRFISDDPIRFGGGIDFYIYVKNRPLDRTDPFGLVDWGKVADWLKATKVYKWVNNTAAYATCYAQFAGCVKTSLSNSASIGRAQGGGAPVYTPDDLEHPSASEGARQCRMAGAGNQNCTDVLQTCITAITPGLSLLPSLPSD